MYYTIEGKRFLCILYMLGLLVGTVFINMSIRMGLFHSSDFLGYIEYIETLSSLDTSAFFSYVCLIRFRQLLIFFVCLYLFSPYIVFCILDFLLSVLLGFFISTLVIRYGWMGMIEGIGFLLPHYIFYGLLLCMIYIYLFRKSPMSHFYAFSFNRHGFPGKNGRLLENKVIVVVFCLLCFAAGCYTEAFINPEIVRFFVRMVKTKIQLDIL